MSNHYDKRISPMLRAKKPAMRAIFILSVIILMLQITEVATGKLSEQSLVTDKKRIQIELIQTDGGSEIDISRFPEITLWFTLKDRDLFLRKLVSDSTMSLYEDYNRIPLNNSFADGGTPTNRLPLNLLVIYESASKQLTDEDLRMIEPIREIGDNENIQWQVCTTRLIDERRGECFKKAQGESGVTDLLGRVADMAKDSETITVSPDLLIEPYIGRSSSGHVDNLILLVMKNFSPTVDIPENKYLSESTLSEMRSRRIKLLIVDLSSPFDLEVASSEKKFLIDKAESTGGGFFTLTAADIEETGSGSLPFQEFFDQYTTPIYELKYQSQAFNDGKPHEIELHYQDNDRIGFINATYLLGIPNQQDATVLPYIETVVESLILLMFLALFIIAYYLGKTQRE